MKNSHFSARTSSANTQLRIQFKYEYLYILAQFISTAPIFMARENASSCERRIVSTVSVFGTESLGSVNKSRSSSVTEKIRPTTLPIPCSHTSQQNLSFHLILKFCVIFLVSGRESRLYLQTLSVLAQTQIYIWKSRFTSR